MAVSLNSVIGFNPVSRSSAGYTVTKTSHVLINPSQSIKFRKRRSDFLVAKSESTVTDNGESSKDTEPASASQNLPPSSDAKPPLKKVPLTARERLRAARVLSRDSESKPATKPEKGRSVLDALRESEKGKKGLPQAPTNIFDDSKRGMPKAGLTFSFPGGNDLFVIIFSFVFISTVMFATTYFVWKVGAIHFNDNSY